MSQIKVGWSMREISLEEPMSLPGQAHMRISEKVHDPVCVTALCVDGGQEPVVFLSGDMLSAALIKPVDEGVRQRIPEFPHYGLVVNGTHTHTTGAKVETPEKSPDGIPIYDGLKYRDFVISSMVDAVCEAWETRAEGGVAYGYGYAVVGYPRRAVYFEDRAAGNPGTEPETFAVMYGNTNQETFSHYEAGADHFVNAMFTFDADEKVTGVVVNIPCPSQVSELFSMQSSDYWNEIREAVRKEFGPDVYVLPQCAAAGDMSPRLLHYKEAQARRMKLKYGLEYDPYGSIGQYNKCMAERYDIAERVLASLKDIYSWAKKDIQTEPVVRHSHKKITMAKRWVTEEKKAWCEANIARLQQNEPQPEDYDTSEAYRKALTRNNSYIKRNQRVLDRYEAQKENNTLETVVHAIQIGEVAFATNRFELYIDYQHRIQARSPFMQTFIVQLCGDGGGGYLPTERATHNKGYSANIHNSLGPEGGQQLVEGTLEMLNELKNQDI